MTSTENKLQPAGGASENKPAEKKAAPRRDDYDAFLDTVDREERASRPRRPAGEKKSPARSGQTAAQKKASPAKKNKKRDAHGQLTGRPAKKRPSKKKKRARTLETTLALLILIGCVAALAGWQYTRYQDFLVMKAAVDRPTFYEGTMVEGVDVSQMTLEQAIEHWKTEVEPGYSQRKVTLSNGAAFSAEELGYTSDYMTVLGNAWNSGRRGSLEERYEALSFRQAQTANYQVTRTPYNEEIIGKCVEAIAEQINRPAENAKIESFDLSNHEFRFSDAVTGSQLDAEQLRADMTKALDAGGGTVELVVRAIQPEIQKNDIAPLYGMITSAVTNASSSSKNRLANIKLAAEYINGVCLKPGETFSFNDVVGKRTSERGFKVATAYSSGKVIEELGGGICQVSTTLFNAAVKADLEIVERHNHSLTVSYVDRGKDAAVNWDSQDLRFTNNSDDNVYILSYVDSDKRVRVGVFGKLLPNGETITVEGVTKDEIEYETVMQPNLALPTGMTAVAQKGKVGYKAEAYKIRWDADGNRISRELLCKSTYRSTNEIIEYGP